MWPALGHYNILSRLGAGGMGEVYLGVDTRLDRKVAIKVLSPDSADDRDRHHRLLREARIIASIDHPNVCTIYEVGQEADRSYIVMQYVEGMTLLERMRSGPVPLAETLDIACQITAALAEAHQHGIVHSDIKPGNIMIDPSGVVKVLDFGVAKRRTTGMDASVTTMATVAALAGTIPYMSPEQLREEPLDGRSDLFSLGVVLYEIVAGTRPFDRMTAAATITAILTDDPVPVDGTLAPVIARALEKQRSGRYPSAAVMREALLAVREGDDQAWPGARTERPQVVTPHSVDLEAEKLYLRGRAHWNKRHPTEIRLAIACFQEAVEREPFYARAYAGLADAYLMLGFLQALPPRDVIPKGKAAALRAIALEPRLAEPHASLGYITGLFEWNWEMASRELLEAMRLNPDYPWAPHWYGILAAPRSLDEAVRHLEQARDLDPLSPILNVAVGVPFHQHQRYRDAIRIYSNVIESELAFAPAFYYIGMSYEQLGAYNLAIANRSRAVEIGGRGALFVGALGHCLGASGDHDAARRVLEELSQRSSDSYVSPYNVMLVHLGLGEHESALTWLERACDDRTGLLWASSVEPRFAPLRGHPRFHQILRQHGLRSEP
jgi:tRNA A-37 threonylcarbamoyl transferase component Bud32